ncbi:uncharacterized protein LOC142584422 [Dermacentor variabilis]|uniref:uncharacterized protein LOC142584422 n=1 Tax=Dermacentor variabilis TaxID=34621 RepID=UPI003F5C7B54
MLNDTQLKALLLVFFTALGSEVFCCKPFEAARGKRLLRLKANIIKIQNQCRKQILAAMKLLTRNDLKKLVEAFCDAHNDCMKSTAEESAIELLDCWSTAARNETGPFHASGAPDDFHPALGDTFECLRNTDLTKLSLQAIDDLTSFGIEYVHVIG